MCMRKIILIVMFILVLIKPLFIILPCLYFLFYTKKRHIKKGKMI